MTSTKRRPARRVGWLLFAAAVLALVSSPVRAEDYANALKGVQRFDAVYDVTQGNPKVANIVFWAVKNSYETPLAAAKDPNTAIVFHGPAVKLISSDRALFNGAEWSEVENFQDTLRQMKKAGVKLEVCLYAAEVMGVDEATIIPEVDRVGNGFVSVVGYQAQGYSLVRIP